MSLILFCLNSLFSTVNFLIYAYSGNLLHLGAAILGVFSALLLLKD